MSLCELSGLGPVVKNKVSHSNIKTKSRAFPNIHKKSFYSMVLKQTFRARISTQALRDIDKCGGVDIYILKQKDQKLSPRMRKIKHSLLKKNFQIKRKSNEAQN